MTETISFTKAYGTDKRLALNAAVWAKSEGRCLYCGTTVELLSTNPDALLSVDHFVSQADGGTDDLSNLVPACKSCNSGKGRRSVETFRWTLYRKANGIPNFSLEQRDWLTAQGFDFVGLSSTLFWFEREGLS